MCLKKGEEIGSEVHKGSQFIRIEKGRGICVVGGVRHRIKDGTGIVIPGGRRHNIINTGKGKLKLYSIYSPPEHPRNKKERNKIVE
jgi:mannose-6-phosphate isomerase-like protein (cupin superfamily)